MPEAPTFPDHFDTNVLASPNRYVVFGDLLGFASLVESSPTPMELDIDAQQRGGVSQLTAVLAWQNPLSATFARFHRNLEKAINETRWGIPLSAVIFSDSFFLASSTSSGAMEFCESFMRSCICGMLPMRMGVGFGSFVTHKFSYQSTSFAQISTAQFLGTGVTNAYAAERCEHRGMRVFLHPTVADHLLRSKTLAPRVMMLGTRSPASHEYSYLLANGESDINEADDVLVRTLTQMFESSATHMRVRSHYWRTREAMTEMAERFGRSIEWPIWSRDVSN